MISVSGSAFKNTLYISPSASYSTSSGKVIVGNSMVINYNGVAGSPTASLFPAYYQIRSVTGNFQTEFTINLSSVDGQTVLAGNYIV